MDWSFLSTAVLIALFVLVGGYWRSRYKDACLRSFDGYHVTVQREGGKTIWGVMSLEPTGMELVYADNIQDDQHIESSYLLYADEYQYIEAIYRYADRLSEERRQMRAADIERSFNQNLVRRALRGLRNFLGTTASSLTDALSLLVGRLRRPMGRFISEEGEVYLNKLGGTVIGQVGAAHDPLLERHVGQRVVVEVQDGNNVHEHVGILKDYSGEFVEILDVQFPHSATLVVKPGSQVRAENVVVETGSDCLQIRNQADTPLLLDGLYWEDREQLVNAVIDVGEEITLYPEADFDEARLELKVIRELDMIIPRRRCVVRHHAEGHRRGTLSEAWYDLIFDVGTMFGADRRVEAREARLRAEVNANPSDAVAAVNLACLLIQRDELNEAEKWLRQALRTEHSLPDSGRRARMELREIQRRRNVLGAARSAMALAGESEVPPATELILPAPASSQSRAASL